MTLHRYVPEKYYTALGSFEPVLQITEGDTVITTTVDNAGYDATNQQVTKQGNPQTGPFYIEPAEPGDTVVIQFDRLWPNRRTGRSAKVIAYNTIDPDFVPEMPSRYPRTYVEWELDLQTGLATLLQADGTPGSFHLPLNPMMGCFGVAPDHGQIISSSTSGTHGGNMDYNGFVTGVTVYLPVFAPGGLLFMGDGHACQGDGEILGTGIEVSFDVQFTVDVLKDKTICWPRGESADYIFTVGNTRPLNQALQHATTEMIRWLHEDYTLDTTEVHQLMGQCLEYDVGNIYDPAFTMVCKLQKSFLKDFGLKK